MTRTRKINLYKKREQHDSPSGRFIAPEAYERLVGEFPQFVVPPKGTTYSYFEVELPADDPRLAEVMHFIEHEAGVKPCIYKSERKGLEEHRAFFVDTRYEYDKPDLQNAAFLEVCARRPMGGYINEGWDQCVLIDVQRNHPMIGTVGSFSYMCCTASIRADLESENFVGLDFLPIEVLDPPHRSEDFWRIWSSRSMPRTCMPLVDDEGAPVKDDYSTGCWRDEDTSTGPLSYRASDLAAMSGVDFALTAEKWNTPSRLNRREILLVSQRVRQWCLKKKLPLKWKPVIALSE